MVCVVELVKEPDQRGVGGLPDLVGQARLGPLVAAALDHPGPAHHVGHHRPQVVLRLSQAGLHALARLDAFGRRWRSLVLQGGLRSVPISDETRETFRLGPRHENMDDGAVRSGRSRVGNHRALPGAPPVAHPHRDVTATVRRWIGAEVEGEPARLLARSMGQPRGTHYLVHHVVEERSALGCHARDVVREPALPVAELGFPIAAFPGLQAVLVVELQQRARVHELVQERWQASSKRRPVTGQVLDQQIRQCLRVCTYADVGPRFARELADKEHKGAEPRFQRSLRRGDVALLDDCLVDLPEQHAGLKQVGRDLVEQEIRRYHRAHGLVSGASDGVVDDAKLRAKLAGHAGAVDCAQCVFPEAPANRQQRIVIHQDGLVLADEGQCGL